MFVLQEHKEKDRRQVYRKLARQSAFLVTFILAVRATYPGNAERACVHTFPCRAQASPAARCAPWCLAGPKMWPQVPLTRQPAPDARRAPFPIRTPFLLRRLQH